MYRGMNAMNFREPPYSERYPELLKLYDDEPGVPKYNKILRNVSYGGRWLHLHNGIDMSLVTMEGNLITDPILCVSFDKGANITKFGDQAMMDVLKKSGNMVIYENPGFVDLDNENFQLRDDSPAYKLGFKRIPIEDIGLYVDEYRTSLPK
jgi:hypothetical protein